MVHEALRRIRQGLNRTDGIVFGVNGVALGLYLANPAWHSSALVYGVTLGTLALFAFASRWDATLRAALAFGVLVALLWAGVEAAMVRVFGWWGAYVVVGPRLLDTPVYCLLVGATGAVHVAYVARRGTVLGFPPAPVAVATVLQALPLAVVGEALFVAAEFWTYVPWDPALWGVPLAVPLAYGLPYLALPWLPADRPVVAALVFQAITFASIAALCLATGFPGR